MSRQNFYVSRRKRAHRDLEKEQILKLVKRERQQQPRVGTRKLHGLISLDLARANHSIGRDRLFALLRAENLLVKRRRKSVKTTNSRHCLPVFRNRFKELELNKPNQAWVSDLTYIRTEEGFMYASLITDAFSRKIVGYHIDDSLESEGCLRALKMAIQNLPQGASPLHHSDRGSQYCSHRYVKALKESQMSVSMTEENHCYENALAERINGILKQEYYMDTCFVTKSQAKTAMKNAVHIYNNRRPHMSLQYNFPNEVHERGYVKKKTLLERAAASVFDPSGHSLRETDFSGRPLGDTKTATGTGLN